MRASGIILKIWHRFTHLKSIRRRISNSLWVIIIMMLIPAIISIIFTSVQTQKYDQLITNVNNIGRLNIIVRETIPDEIFEIVAGKKEFREGSQYEVIAYVNGQLDTLIRLSPDADNQVLLEVARRTMDQLESAVDKLGEQIETRQPVAEHELTLEQIRGVTALITDLLQEYVLQELETAAKTNQAIITTSQLTVTLEIVITVVACLVAIVTQMAVSRSISRPILELERLAGRIAQGDLAARAQGTDVSELKELTASLNAMAGKLQELIDANKREQENLKKSEMRALQAQITPHFLYNTLDAIMWLAQSNRNDEVIRMTQAMSSFFRIVLSRGRDWITVSQEIEHVQSYLTVQHVRYRDILEYSLDIDPRLNEHLMLKLVLQPLVENAIYHGIKLRRDKGNIWVRGWLQDDSMCFCVRDDGIGIKADRLLALKKQLAGDMPAEEGDGYGLYNVDKRLRLYYGQNTGLTIESEFEKGTTVSFCVPVRSNTEDV